MSYSKRFSIDDAFEDEPIDDIKVYVSSQGNSPLQSPGPTKLSNYGGIDNESISRTKKFEDVSVAYFFSHFNSHYIFLLIVIYI